MQDQGLASEGRNQMVSLEQEKRQGIAPFLFPALPLLNLLRRDATVAVAQKRILIVDDDPDIRQVLSDVRIIVHDENPLLRYGHSRISSQQVEQRECRK